MEKKVINTGIFERPFMDSKVMTEKMSVKEKILGYLVGPFGVLALMAVVNQLAELYYTEIFYIDRIFGVGTYLVMSWVTKIISMLAGLGVAYLVEHTESRQGKIRPYILIGELICAVSAFFMFAIPDFKDSLKLVWVYAFNILYNGIGITMFNLRTNMMSLGSRDQNDRNQVNLLDRISAFLLVGTAVTLVVGSVLYYTFLHGYPKENWLMLIGIVALISVPLSVINYFYTYERVTVDAEEIEGSIYNREEVPVWTRVKQLFKSRYWTLAFILGLINMIVSNLQGYNLNTNFCTVILGATAGNNYNLFYTIASGLPLGMGILIIYPMSKKLTIRKTTMIFSVISVIGCVMGLMVKNAFWPAVASFFVYNLGTLANVYILNALIYSTNDDVEYRYNFRPEGTVALAVTVALSTVISGAFAGVYETGLSYFGYMPLAGTDQPAGVINWLYFIRYIVPIVQCIFTFVILFFLDIEKKLPQMQQEILERKNK
ncbi:MAG: MFS transporter [Christensenellaceae bacterium]|nr:MFS transporter [Christensenellaceae bacterium]